MGSPTAERNGISRAMFLASCMLLALLPLTPVQASDMGAPEHLQAQNIEAVFDPETETTLITWQNINSSGLELQGLFSATYNIYRHSAPINETTISEITPFATMSACDAGAAGFNPFNCTASFPAGQHSTSFLVSPGTNGSFYYAITTTHQNGTEIGEFHIGGAHIEFPVLEITTPVTPLTSFQQTLIQHPAKPPLAG